MEQMYEPTRRAFRGRSSSPTIHQRLSVWGLGFTLIIRIWFGGIFCYNYNKEPQNPTLNIIIKAPTLWEGAWRLGLRESLEAHLSPRLGISWRFGSSILSEIPVNEWTKKSDNYLIDARLSQGGARI